MIFPTCFYLDPAADIHPPGLNPTDGFRHVGRIQATSQEQAAGRSQSRGNIPSGAVAGAAVGALLAMLAGAAGFL